MMKRIIFAVLLLVSGASLGWAKEATPVMGDAAMQERVMKLSGELRCLVCQGQSLADSHSDFALDMRRKIQSLMEQGMSDAQVKDFLVARYGDFILYRPPLTSTTALVWFGPLILFVLGAGVLLFNIKRRRKVVSSEPPPLSTEEQARVQGLLNGDTGERKA